MSFPFTPTSINQYVFTSFIYQYKFSYLKVTEKTAGNPTAAFEIPTRGGGLISRKWLLFLEKAKAEVVVAVAWVVVEAVD